MTKIRIFVDKEVNVEISPKVIEKWKRHRQDDFFGTEACGILIGSYFEKSNTIKIMQCTEPMPLDERHRYEFTMKDPGHKKAIDMAFYHSDGERNYLGTWHTHRESNPRPSEVDKQDWKNVIRSNPEFSQFAFVIVGTESISIFPKKGLAKL